MLAIRFQEQAVNLVLVVASLLFACVVNAVCLAGYL
jgi:hypothetical protein